MLSRSGGPPLPHDAGLKDTVALSPGEAVEIITRFDCHRGRYHFHCHNAEHEDIRMIPPSLSFNVLELAVHPC